MDKLKIQPRVAATGIGAQLGILIVWGLRDGIGLSPGDTEVGAIIGLCAFFAAWALKD